MSTLTLITTAILVASILTTINFTISMSRPNTNKLSPYECGFDPHGSARSPVSIQFFLVAILFLLFDLEIVLLLPTPWAMNNNTPEITLLTASLFILLLVLGLAYEWTQGGLEWAH
uniref:NADH-ubiquinone oxidoreductase chain 3 n=1 Tax=Rena humilis TaxID=711330 RepID=Q6I7Y0_RENHU|nr:NADH dehydrogenase subunit 3 [Rena humilis]BAD24744.1 NADH dehydrogenase subunit 3 [Rena humilis]